MGVEKNVERIETSTSSGSRRGGPGLGDTPSSTTLESAVANPNDVHRIAGERLGGSEGTRFEVLERLGGGGMSEVFLARDTVLDRTVAIKFLTGGGLDTAEALARIQLEARACARLNHENIVRLFDMGTDRGVPFLVMEHLEGRSLDALLNEERVDARRAVRILIDVARGLGEAHRAGVVHRDLKPSNVFVTKEGTAKILDFGVASIADRADWGRAPGHGPSGTPGYMSPEQWRGQPQDGRSDIWALGIMLFELLAGASPFPTGTLAELRDAVVSSNRAPRLRDARPDLPEEADAIALRALEKATGARYGTAEELLDGLVSLEVALARAMRKDGERGERVKPDRRLITVLSCALHDAPELPGDESKLDDIGELLDEFFEMGTTVVKQLEGTLLSAIGARIIACFGYPAAREHDAHRALRAASLIVDALRSTSAGGKPLAVRIGVATSLAIANGIGRSPPHLRGDAPHVAQWLESQAGPNEILIAESTRALVSGVFHLEPRGEAAAENGARPIGIHRVLRSREAPTRFDPLARGELTPLVGRDQELGELGALWESVKAGHGRFVLMIGEAGIGKSRLLERHLERTAEDARRIVHCQCWPYSQNSALAPIAEGLLHDMGLAIDTPADEKLRLLEAALAEVDLHGDSHAVMVAAALGIPTGERRATSSLSPDTIRKKTLETLVALFMRRASRQPSVLVVEDAHWSDASTIELLDRLLAGMGSSRLMILVTARTEFQSPWPQRSHLRRLSLAKLSGPQTVTMIALASKGRALSTPLVQKVVQRADGVPLFIEELTHHIVGATSESEPPSGVDARDAIDSSTIPATLDALLRTRLDALPQDGQDVARVLAVLGRDATYDRIAKTWEHGEESLRAGLMQLVDADILRHRGEAVDARYGFKHALVKDAAYQSLTKSKRAALHRRAADVLLARFPGVVEQNPEFVAAHAMEAGSHDEAVTYFHQAGERALARSANVDAATHCRRAIEQLRRLPEGPSRARRELDLQLALGRALLGAQWSAEIREVHDRIRELGRDAGTYDAQPFALLGLWRFHVHDGDLQRAMDLGWRLMACAEKIGDSRAKLHAHNAIALTSVSMGDLVTSDEHAAAALLLYDEREHRDFTLFASVDPYVDSGVCQGCVHWLRGAPDRAIAAAREAIRHTRQTGHAFSLALVLAHLGVFFNWRGEYEEGRIIADETVSLSEEHGFAATRAWGEVVRGWSRAATGEREGLQELERGASEQLAAGMRVGMTVSLTCLAWARWHAADLEGAVRALDDAAAFVDAGERFMEAELLRLRGEVLLAKGADPAVASDWFERGLALARRQQAKAWELRLSLSQARLWARGGRAGDAKALLAPIVASFTEGLSTRDVRDARDFLQSLEPRSNE